MEGYSIQMGKKAQTGRELKGKQQWNKMEGTKYTQYKRTGNITCMILLSHISRILSRVACVSYTFRPENQTDVSGSPAFRVRSKIAYFSNLCLDFVEQFRRVRFTYRKFHLFLKKVLLHLFFYFSRRIRLKSNK